MCQVIKLLSVIGCEINIACQPRCKRNSKRSILEFRKSPEMESNKGPRNSEGNNLEIRKIYSEFTNLCLKIELRVNLICPDSLPTCDCIFDFQTIFKMFKIFFNDK